MTKRKDNKIRFSIQILFEGDWFVLASGLTREKAIARMAECERANEYVRLVPDVIVTEGMTL